MVFRKMELFMWWLFSMLYLISTPVDIYLGRYDYLWINYLLLFGNLFLYVDTYVSLQLEKQK